MSSGPEPVRSPHLAVVSSSLDLKSRQIGTHTDGVGAEAEAKAESDPLPSVISRSAGYEYV